MTDGNIALAARAAAAVLADARSAGSDEARASREAMAAVFVMSRVSGAATFEQSRAAALGVFESVKVATE